MRTRDSSGSCAEKPLSNGSALSGVERHTLPNGLTVILRRDSRAPVVAVVTWVRAGYFDEPDDLVGISHVLEHMYFKGTPTLGPGELARATKGAGGYLNAHTIYDHTAYYTVLPSASLSTALRTQSDAFANSSIAPGELARELEVIIEEAKRKRDNPSAVAAESLYELMHSVHRIRRWRIGSEDGLRRLQRSDVLGFYRKWYTPSNTVVCVVGDADTSRMLELVQESYGGIPDSPTERDRGPSETELQRFAWRDLQGDITRTQLLFGWRTPGVMSDLTPALDVGAMILGSGRGSRLYRSVRDRKLASHISAGNFTPGDVGVFTVHAETGSAELRECLLTTWSEVLALTSARPGDWELERIRGMHRAQQLRRLESMDGQAMWLASWEALGGWELGVKYNQDVEQLTGDAVVEALRQSIDTRNVAVMVYRPRESEALAASAEEARELLAAQAPAPGGRAGSNPAPVIRHPQPTLTLVESSAGARLYRTESGVPVLVRRQRGAPLVHASWHRRGGACTEHDANAGITLLAARSATRGTHRRTSTQLAEELEATGSTLRASAGTESFGWSCSAPSAARDVVLDILADVVMNAALSPASVGSERAVLLGELEQSRDDMYRRPLQLALRAAYGDHPYGRPVEGHPDSVHGHTAENVTSWYRRMVHESGEPVLCIVGDDDEDELALAIARHFRHLGRGGAESVAAPDWHPGEPVVEEREKAQTAMAVLFPGVGRADPRRYAASLLATICSGLGGRFFDSLRDRESLAYTVHTFSTERSLGGVFGGYIATSPSKERTAMDGMLREFAALVSGGVTESELERARAYTLGARAIRLQSGAAVLGEMLEAWLFGSLTELENTEREIRSVSGEQILEFAAGAFDSARMASGIVRGR